MTNKRRRFKKGVILDPDTTALTEEGGVKYDDTAKKVQYRDNAGTKSIVSEDGTQTLENKTIDGTSASGNNTVTADADNITYDNSTSGLTATDVKAAIDEVQSNIEGKDEASEISYDNSTSGLTATDVQDAIDENDSNLDTHIADTSAHGTVGNVVGTTDSQTLENKTIDADSNTISNIDNNEIKAAAGIEATKIADGSVDDAEFQRLNGVTSDIQTQLDNKLSGIGASSDNAIIRNDGTTGNSFQESGVTIDDSDIVSGITQLNVDNIRVDGNTISSTDTNGNVELSPDGTGIVKANSDHQVTGNVIRDVSADTATGANVTLTAPSTKNIRLTDGSLESIDMIPAGTDGQEIVLINATGNVILVNDSTGATAANQIKTGTQAAIQLSDEASIPLVYDATEAKWMVSAGVGSDSISDKSVYAQFDAEDQNVTDFTNISVTETSPINQNYSYSVDSYPASLPSVSINDRSKDRENNVQVQYTMTSGTAKLLVKDNSSNTLAELEIESSSSVQPVNIPYFVRNTVTSIQLEIEDVSSATGLKIDDIIFSDDPFVYRNLLETTSVSAAGNDGTAITANTEDINWTEINDSENAFDGQIYTVQRDDSTVNISLAIRWTTASTRQVNIYKNGSNYRTLINAVNTNRQIASYISEKGEFVAGDEISFRVATGGTLSNDTAEHYLNINEETEAEYVVTPAKSNLTGWTSFTPVLGSFGTVTNAVGMYRRVGDSLEVEASFQMGTTVAADATIDLPISGINIDTDKIASGNQNILGFWVHVNNTANYTPVSAGAGVLFSDKTDTNSLFFSTRATSDGNMEKTDGGFIGSSGNGISLHYKVPIAEWSENTTFLAAVPVDDTIIVSDVKPSGTDGGTFTSGSYQTRTLNTIERGAAFGSLSSNQLTLPKGEYYINGYAVASSVNKHKAILYDVTNAQTAIAGSNAVSSSGDNTTSNSSIDGFINITSSTVFELRHRCNTTNAGDGFGQSTGYGDDEVFSRLIIKKIK